MADRDESPSGARTATSASPAGRSYLEATGERIEQTLDIDSWDPAHKVAEQFDRLQNEIVRAQISELETRRDIRARIFPLLGDQPGAPACAGVHGVALDDLRQVQRQLLFSGHVQAVDGASVVHETLPITIVQTAVALANYLGEHGTWGHRIFQKDLKVSGQDPIERTMALLERRAEADEADGSGISDMLRRGLMANAELAVLASKANAPWRMGHGHPLPKELLTGAGMPELIELSVPLFRKLLLEHRRFVYLPRGTRSRLLQTIGDALVPLEFAIVEDVSGYLNDVIEGGHYGQGKFQAAKRLLDDFKAEADRKSVV